MQSTDVNNPYESPPRITGEGDRRLLARPIGIWIASILNALPGTVLFVVLAAMVAQSGPDYAIRFVNSQGSGAVVALLLIFPLGIISGVGLWTGCRWSWYVAIFFCATSLYAAIRIWTHLAPSARELPAMLVNSCVLLYLITERPRQFLRIRHRHAYSVVIGVLLLAVAQYHALVWLMRMTSS